MKTIDKGPPLGVALAVQVVGLALALFATESVLIGALIVLASGVLSYAVGRAMSHS